MTRSSTVATQVLSMIPTSTRVHLDTAARLPASTDAIAVFINEKTPQAADLAPLAAAERRAFQQILDSGLARGKAREVTIAPIAAEPGSSRRALIIGLGPLQKTTPETYRQAGGALARAARRHRLAHVAVILAAG